jgi:farnesyl-diphosphate farnesyltransferase
MLTIYQLLVAWLAGARFDIAYYQMKEQLGDLLGWNSSNMTKIAEVTKVVEAVPAHSEL